MQPFMKSWKGPDTRPLHAAKHKNAEFSKCNAAFCAQFSLSAKAIFDDSTQLSTLTVSFGVLSAYPRYWYK